MSSYEEKLKLQEQGFSYTQIAKILGISPQAVRQALSKHNPNYFRPFSEKGCIFKGLREWLNRNKVSRAELIRRMGYESLSDTSIRFRNYLSGVSEFRKRDIDKILEVTGLTYEQVFGDPDAVDVAPIVRCKDCERSTKGFATGFGSCCWCSKFSSITYDNDFCSYGRGEEK